MSNNVMGQPAKPDNNGQTVKIKFYRAGKLEGWFMDRARKAFEQDKQIMGDIYSSCAVVCRGTRQFFTSTGVTIKGIRFTKYHLAAWGKGRILDVAFLTQGLVGILSLGLWQPSITRRATIGYSRAAKDLHVFLAGEKMESNTDLPEDQQETVPKYLQDAVQRQKMSDEELMAEFEAKLSAINAEDTK